MSLEEKVLEYYQRGRRPLSKEEIEDALARLPRMFRVPKKIYVIDGVVKADGAGVGFFRTATDYIVLTPLSDLDTLYHEVAHYNGLGEIAANIIGKLFSCLCRPRVRRVRYREMMERGDEVARKLGLMPAWASMLPPEVKVYVLEEDL